MTTDDAKTYLSKREIPRLFESLMTGLMYHRPGDHIKYLIDCLTKVHDKGQDNITWSSFVDIRRSKTPLPPISNGQIRPNSKGSSRPTSRTRTPKGEEILSLNMGNIEDAIISRVMSPTSASRVMSPIIPDTITSPRGERVISPISPDTITSPRGERVLSPLVGTSRGPTRTPVGRNTKSEEPTQSVPQDVRTKSPPLPPIPSTDKISLPDIPIVLVMGAPGSCKDIHVEKLLSRYNGWTHLNMGTLIKDEIARRGDAHTKWKMTRDLLSRGEVAPEEVTIEVLIDGLQKCSSAKGIVVTGFPRNITQVGDYEKQICRVDAVFMIDCEESAAQERLLRRGKNSNRPEDSMTAIATRMNYFKAHTLGAAKFYDDQGKLIIIDGDKGEEPVQYDIGKAFDDIFYGKYGSTPLGSAPPTTRSVPTPSEYKGKYEDDTKEEEIDKNAPLFIGAVPQPPTISEADTGRKPGLPTCPIIFVSGGPGSGKGTQCARIIKRYPDFVHLSMGDIIRKEISTKGTADEKWGMISQLVSKGEMAPEEVTIDVLKEQLMKHSSAKAFIIEGFPREKSQVEAFNKTIGGLNFVMLFDCDEYSLKTRLLNRGKEGGRIDDNMAAIANRINFYKYNTLPVMKHFEDAGKLVVLDADRDMEEMFYDISQLFDFAFFKRPEEKASDDKLELDAEQAEAAIKIQAGFRGYMVRSGKGESSPAPASGDTPAPTDTTTEDKSKDKDSKMYITETSAVGALSEREIATQKIQASFQGLKTRKESGKPKKTINSGTPVLSNRKQPEQSEEEIAEAASRIQAGFRGYKTRQEMKARTEAQDKHQDEAQDKNQAQEQEADRSEAYAGQNEVKNESQNEAKEETQNKAQTEVQNEAQSEKCNTEETEAIARIQAGYRGYKARQEVASMRQQQHSEDAKQDSTSAPVQDEVVEETITPQVDTTTGNNVENPSQTQALDEAAKS